MKMSTTIQDLLCIYPIRRLLKTSLHPYDFASAMIAFCMEPTDHEKSGYLNVTNMILNDIAREDIDITCNPRLCIMGRDIERLLEHMRCIRDTSDHPYNIQVHVKCDSFERLRPSSERGVVGFPIRRIGTQTVVERCNHYIGFPKGCWQPRRHRHPTICDDTMPTSIHPIYIQGAAFLSHHTMEYVALCITANGSLNDYNILSDDIEYFDHGLIMPYITSTSGDVIHHALQRYHTILYDKDYSDYIFTGQRFRPTLRGVEMSGFKFECN